MPEITDSVHELINDIDWCLSQQMEALKFIEDSIREHDERQLPVDGEWLLSLGCTMVPCNVHGTPDADFKHPSGLQFWEHNGTGEWCCVDPQFEGFKTRGVILDLLQMVEDFA